MEQTVEQSREGWFATSAEQLEIEDAMRALERVMELPELSEPVRRALRRAWTELRGVDR